MTRNDNIHRKEGAEFSGQKFSFYDAVDGSLDLLFTTKLQEEAQVRCLRGVFLGEEVGDNVMVTWLPNNKRLDSLTFRKERRNVRQPSRHDFVLQNPPRGADV